MRIGADMQRVEKRAPKSRFPRPKEYNKTVRTRKIARTSCARLLCPLPKSIVVEIIEREERRGEELRKIDAESSAQVQERRKIARFALAENEVGKRGSGHAAFKGKAVKGPVSFVEELDDACGERRDGDHGRITYSFCKKIGNYSNMAKNGNNPKNGNSAEKRNGQSSARRLREQRPPLQQKNRPFAASPSGARFSAINCAAAPFGPRLHAVFIAPVAHSVEDGHQRLPALGKAVFHLRRDLRIFFADDQSVPLQLLQR